MEGLEYKFSTDLKMIIVKRFENFTIGYEIVSLNIRNSTKEDQLWYYTGVDAVFRIRQTIMTHLE